MSGRCWSRSCRQHRLLAVRVNGRSSRIVAALRYLLRGGLPWRMLLPGFQAMTTVQRYFHASRDSGLWQALNRDLLMILRLAEGRAASPSAGVIDSQSVKTALCCGIRGYDAGKKIKGRKRHILTPMSGRGRHETDKKTVRGTVFPSIGVCLAVILDLFSRPSPLPPEQWRTMARHRLGHQQPDQAGSGNQGAEYGSRPAQTHARLHPPHGSRIAILCP